MLTRRRRSTVLAATESVLCTTSPGELISPEKRYTDLSVFLSWSATSTVYRVSRPLETETLTQLPRFWLAQRSLARQTGVNLDSSSAPPR